MLRAAALAAALSSASAAAAATTGTAAARGPKAIFTILIDDLGSYDTAVNNPDIGWLTPNLHQLSHEGGLQLSRFYVNKFCSPTRRGFLSGRFPVSVSMMQAQPCDNTLPLEATLLSQKLKQAPTPWANHFIGKGHLGYPTTDHLPVNRGFDSHLGYLMGAENYEYGFNENKNDGHDCAKSMHGQCVYDMWHDTHTGESIHEDIFYSTNYYTSRAISILHNHTQTAPSQPLWVHLMYQGVHSPYSESPAWEQIDNSSQSNSFWQPHPFGDMLRAVDTGIGNLTAAIHDVTGLWEDTLLIITSDNGGIGPGNNFPLRGHKSTPWEGGTRVMGFLAGGYLPSNLHGKTYDGLVSVADWYPTMCHLAGVSDCTDNKVFMGKMRPLDGNDVWGRIIANFSATTNDEDDATAQLSPYNHEWFPSTAGALIYQERWKLITNAASTFWYTPKCGSAGGLKTCCDATCRAAISDQGPANQAAWPCRGGSSPPGPPAPPPTPGPPCAEPGYQCRASSYCGPSQSFYWTGKADTSECAAMCSANATCHCFDSKGPDGAISSSSSSGRGLAGKQAECRLHVSAAGVTHSGAGYIAYWKKTADSESDAAAATSLAAREAADEARELQLAMPAGMEQGCNVCTHEYPCLFDLSQDEQERKNLASAEPALVKLMVAKLATFSAYFGTKMDPEVLAAKYDCPDDIRPWYGNFSGPCCRPKAWAV